MISLELMYNMTGTFVAMTQILLPYGFTIVQCYENYSSFINESWSSLGGTPFHSLEKYIFL